MTSEEIQHLISHLINQGDLSVRVTVEHVVSGRQYLDHHFSYLAPGRVYGYRGTPKFSYGFSDPEDVDYWLAKDYGSEAEFAQFLAQEIDHLVVKELRKVLTS
ncbi:MAG: hypothetical protein MUC97_09745 [Bernardetiaceae bacterium]|nr:hypothetical protein [Bernardetiaceae bacterium]